jgi:NAD-dependent dihydropyrimidine dehydrogenase PreA subunit
MPECHSEVSEVTIRIDHDKCTGAARCTDVCPAGVYELVDAKAYPNNADDCIQCCACDGICPEDAIWHSAWSE